MQVALNRYELRSDPVNLQSLKQPDVRTRLLLMGLESGSLRLNNRYRRVEEKKVSILTYVKAKTEQGPNET